MANLYNNVKIEQLLNPITATSTRTSSNADTQGYYECIFIAHIGLSLDTLNGSNYWTVQLEESDDGSAFTDVADSDTVDGSATAVINSGSLDEQAYVFAYKGSKRYVRIVITSTGTHSVGTPQSVTALLAKPAVAPVS